jgi:hypothetical protein
MAYIDTPAFMTKSTSRHGGDGRWPPVKRLVIRRANLVVHGNNPENLPGANLGDFDVASLISALSTVTKTVMSIKEQEDDRKAARAKQASEDAAAAAASKAAADQAAAQLKAINAAASPAARLGVDNETLLIAGGGAVGLVLLYLLLRKK